MIDQSEEGFVVGRREEEGKEVGEEEKEEEEKECSGDSQDCDLRAKLSKY